MRAHGASASNAEVGCHRAAPNCPAVDHSREIRKHLEAQRLSRDIFRVKYGYTGVRLILRAKAVAASSASGHCGTLHMVV